MSEQTPDNPARQPASGTPSTSDVNLDALLAEAESLIQSLSGEVGEPSDPPAVQNPSPNVELESGKPDLAEVEAQLSAVDELMRQAMNETGAASTDPANPRKIDPSTAESDENLVDVRLTDDNAVAAAEQALSAALQKAANIPLPAQEEIVDRIAVTETPTAQVTASVTATEHPINSPMDNAPPSAPNPEPTIVAAIQETTTAPPDPTPSPPETADAAIAESATESAPPSTLNDTSQTTAPDTVASPPSPETPAATSENKPVAPPPRTGLILLLWAPLWLLTYFLMLLDRPFASVSHQTKRNIGIAACVTFFMGTLAWVLPFVTHGRAQ